MLIFSRANLYNIVFKVKFSEGETGVKAIVIYTRFLYILKKEKEVSDG